MLLKDFLTREFLEVVTRGCFKACVRYFLFFYLMVTPQKL